MNRLFAVFDLGGPGMLFAFGLGVSALLVFPLWTILAQRRTWILDTAWREADSLGPNVSTGEKADRIEMSAATAGDPPGARWIYIGLGLWLASLMALVLYRFPAIPESDQVGQTPGYSTEGGSSRSR